jgi:hypothetical protein
MRGPVSAPQPPYSRRPQLGLSRREFTDRQAPGFNSAKAEAIAFLSELFDNTLQLTVRDVETQARGVGLLGANQAISQCRALRDARVALGLVAMREGFGRDGVWIWAKPAGPQRAAPAVASPPVQPAQVQNL